MPNDAPIDVIVDSPAAASSQRGHDIFAAANEAWQLNDVHVRTLETYLAEIETGGVLGTV